MVGLLATSAGGLAAPADSSPTPRPGVSWPVPEQLRAPAFKASMALPARPLSLAELTDFALLNNPRTREVWAAARAEAAALGIAEAAFFPTIDGLISATRTRSNNSSANTSNASSSGSQTRISPGISLSYVLFDFGARAATADAARFGLLAANLTQNRALQDVVLQVEQAYFSLLGARQTIVAARQTLATAQASLDAANARRAAGLATIGDVYQAQTALAQARLAHERASGEAAKFRGELATAVGLPANAPLDVAPADTPPTREIKSTVDAYLEQARQTRPDLIAAEAQFRAARASIDAETAQGLPSLELGANVGRTYNSNGNDTSNNSITLNLRIPLFNGYRTRYAINQAEARAEQAAAARDRIALQVELEVWQAYYDLETARAQIESARALLASATLSREVAQERYRAGVGNVLEVLTAQAAEADARLQSIQAELSWYSALARLNNAIGILATAPVERG